MEKKTFCPNCGNEIDTEDVFCSNCGSQIIPTDKDDTASKDNNENKGETGRKTSG